MDAFEELCATLGVTADGAAAIQSWLPERQVICIIGLPTSLVVKVGGLNDAGITREAALLNTLNSRVGPVVVPRVHWQGVWRDHLVLATEAIHLANTQSDVSVDEAVAAATALSLGSATGGPMVHGDLSPWNLLRTTDGMALVDWEDGRRGREPLFDVAHFVVTCAALLRHEPPELALAQLTLPGSPGWRHLEALDVEPRIAPALLSQYLERSWAHNENSWVYRRSLLALLGVGSGRAPGPPQSAAATDALLDVVSARGAGPPQSAAAADTRPESPTPAPR